MLLPILAIGGLFLLAGAGKKKGPRSPKPAPLDQQILNYCVSQGGELVEMQGTDGNVYVVCQFPDGRAVVAEDFFQGTAAPECPTDLLWDPATEQCLPVVGSCQAMPPSEEAPYGWVEDQTTGDCIPAPAPTPSSEEEAYQMCLASFGEVWAENHIVSEMADNLALVMTSALAETTFLDPAVLSDIGMAYLAPVCDWEWMKSHIETLPSGPPQWLTSLYIDVYQLAEYVIAASGEPDITPGPIPGPGPHPPPLPIPDGGGSGGLTGVEKCPPNYFYDALHDVCCPDGFYYNVDEGMCRPMGYGGQRRTQAPGSHQNCVDCGEAHCCGPDMTIGKCCALRSEKRPRRRRKKRAKTKAVAGARARYQGNGIKFIPKKGKGFMGACGAGGCGAKWVPNRGERRGNAKSQRGAPDQRQAYAGFGVRVGSIPQTRG